MCDFFFISTSQVQGKHGLDGDLVAKSSIFAGGKQILGGDKSPAGSRRWRGDLSLSTNCDINHPVCVCMKYEMQEHLTQLASGMSAEYTVSVFVSHLVWPGHMQFGVCAGRKSEQVNASLARCMLSFKGISCHNAPRFLLKMFSLLVSHDSNLTLNPSSWGKNNFGCWFTP